MSDGSEYHDMIERLEQDNARLESELAGAKRELESFRSRDTDSPPTNELPTSRAGLLGVVAQELSEFRVAVGGLASEVELTGRMTVETRRTVIEDMPGIIQKAVTNATIELATRLSQLGAEHEDLKSQVRSSSDACEGCPRRKLAGV